MPLVLEEVVAALAQRVPEEDGALHEVDGVLRRASGDFPGHDGIRLCPVQRGLDGLFQPSVVALERELRSRLQQLRDLRGNVVAVGKLFGGLGHGITS